MTASNQIKGLLAGVAAVALIGTAMAQGNPPNPAIKSAPIGAGQQSSQKTPMGDTGTPTGAPMATGSTSSSSSTNMGSAPMSGGTTSMGSAGTSADTSMASAGDRTRRPMRRARADRN